MRVKHVEGPSCPKCDQIIRECHLDIQSWWQMIKGRFPDAHVSCGFRGEADQNRMVLEKKSLLKWPHSKHNIIRDGKPMSEAMDLFRLRDGKAEFPIGFYMSVACYLEDVNAPIAWGGTWKKLRDYPHYELRREED